MIRGLISSLAVLSVLASCMIAVSDKDTAVYLRFCCGLCALCIFSAVLPGKDVRFPADAAERVQIEDMTGTAAELIRSETVNRLAAAVKELAYEKYGVGDGDIDVSISAGGDPVRIGSVGVKLYGLKYALCVTELKHGVSDLLGVECEVEIIE